MKALVAVNRVVDCNVTARVKPDGSHKDLGALNMVNAL